jgi:hypothetical protein
MKSPSLVVFAVVAAAALPLPATAQNDCAEGMTASGQCVDPNLAADVRQTAIIFSLPKISYTAFPILPNGDFAYRYPHNLIPDPLTSAASGNPARVGSGHHGVH